MNRRQLLRLMGGGAGVLILTDAWSGCSPAKGSVPAGPVSAMKVSDLAVGSLHVLSSNLAVALDSKGVYAMSAVCTHAGCIVEDNPRTIAAGLSCPCHGSTFDGNGNVTQGPARAPLQHYDVSIASDGSITVDAGKPVAADVRAPVP